MENRDNHDCPCTRLIGRWKEFPIFVGNSLSFWWEKSMSSHKHGRTINCWGAGWHHQELNQNDLFRVTNAASERKMTRKPMSLCRHLGLFLTNEISTVQIMWVVCPCDSDAINHANYVSSKQMIYKCETMSEQQFVFVRPSGVQVLCFRPIEKWISSESVQISFHSINTLSIPSFVSLTCEHGHRCHILTARKYLTLLVCSSAIYLRIPHRCEAFVIANEYEGICADWKRRSWVTPKHNAQDHTQKELAVGAIAIYPICCLENFASVRAEGVLSMVIQTDSRQELMK
jgi:hypothetical protein